MDGDWSILDVDAYVDCRDLYNLVKTRGIDTEVVPINAIYHKPLCNISKTQGRYLNADISLPVLLCTGTSTPNDRTYRMLDGRHRLLKAISHGHSSILAYVVSKQDVMKFVRT